MAETAPAPPVQVEEGAAAAPQEVKEEIKAQSTPANPEASAPAPAPAVAPAADAAAAGSMTEDEAEKEALRQGGCRAAMCNLVPGRLGFRCFVSSRCLLPCNPARACLLTVEFYFADANLPFDKFLFALTRKDNGWVPIATLASFKRMRPIKDTLGVPRIAEVLRRSTELLEVDESGEKVRRKKELVPVTDAYQRSAYAVSRWRESSARGARQIR